MRVEKSSLNTRTVQGTGLRHWGGGEAYKAGLFPRMLCRLGLAGRGLIESLGAAVKGRAPARASGEVTPRRAQATLV